MKTMRMTGSKLYIVAQCPAAGALPAVAEEVGEPAHRGTAVHAFLDKVADLRNASGDLDSARVDALALVPEQHREACEALDLERLPLGGQWEHEVGFAFNVNTRQVRRLGEGMTHDDTAAFSDTDELVMVVDVVGRTETEAIALDFKTGWRRLPEAVQSEQLALAGLCVSKHFGLGAATVGHVILREGQRAYFNTGLLDAFGLAAWEEALLTTHANVLDHRRRVAALEPLDYSLGGWCRYCPAKLHCEAQTKLIRAMALKPVTLEEAVKEKLTDETAAQAINRLEVLHEAMNRAWAALYAYAEEHPVTMPDGRVLRKGTKTPRVFVPEITAQVLTKAVGAEAAMAAFDLKASIKRIEGVARTLIKEREAVAAKLLPAPGKGEKPKRLTLVAVKDALLGLIEKAGGRVTVKKETVDFFRGPADESDDE